MTMSHSGVKLRISQILVIIGWILLIFSSLSIGSFEGNHERSPAVVNFLSNPGLQTLRPFLGWMAGIVVVTGPGALLGLFAWSLGELRSAKRLTTVGLFVVLFALFFNVVP